MSPKLKKSLTPCLTELKSLAQAEHTNTRIVRDAVDGIAQIHDNEDVEYVYLPFWKEKGYATKGRAAKCTFFEIEEPLLWPNSHDDTS